VGKDVEEIAKQCRSTNSNLLRRILIEATYLATLTIIYLVTLYPALKSPYLPGWGGDAYGHLFKIWELMNEGYVKWTQYWHGGDPFLTFYSPLSYFIGALIGKIVNSDALGYKLTILIGMLIGAYSMRFLLRELRFKGISIYLSSLFYPLSIWILYYIVGGGLFPRFFANMLLPLGMLGVIYLVKYKDIKKVLLSSLFLSALFLSHLMIFIIFALSIIILLPYLYLNYIKNLSLKNFVKNILIFSASFILLTAFWTIPFLLQMKYYNTFYFYKEPPTFQFYSVSIENLFDISNKYYVGILFILGLLGHMLFLLRKDIKVDLKIFSINSLLIISLFVFLALGYYNPIRGLYYLPIIANIHPERWIDGANFYSLIGFALLISTIEDSKVQKDVKALLIIAILLIVLADFSFKYPIYVEDEKYFDSMIKEYANILNCIDNIEGSRLYQPSVEFAIGSAIAYYPAIIKNIPILRGWYWQGDINLIPHNELHYAIYISILSTYPNITKYYYSLLDKYLSHFSINYIILDKYNQRLPYNVFSNVIEKIGFRKICESSRFALFYRDNDTFIILENTSTKILFIGNENAIRNILIQSTFLGENLSNCLETRSCTIINNLDNLTYDEIKNYKIIFLYSYHYTNSSIWKILEKFIREGGIVFVDTFLSSDMENSILGVSSMVIKVKGKLNLSSDIYDVEKFSEFEDNGNYWVSTAYSGDLIPLIRYENYTILGYKEIGNGRIYFIGLSLFYHSIVKNNPYEQSILRNLIAQHLKSSFKYWIAQLTNEKITVIISADSTATISISENYYPYWRAKLNGREIPVRKNEFAGTIELDIPRGTWILELEYVYPWSILDLLSLAAFTAITAYIGLGECVENRVLQTLLSRIH